MAQFKRSIQSTGFRPEEVTNQNITQLQAYSDRITNALREERDAVISNRNRTADALKENAQIEERQLARNADIQDRNIQTKIKEQTDLSLKAQQDFETRTRASKQIFRDLGDLSLTASLKLQEMEVEGLKKKWGNEYAEMILLGENHPKYKQMEALFKEAQIETINAQTDVTKAQANGLDPLEAVRQRSRINDLSPGYRLAALNILGNQYNTFHNEWFMDKTRQYTDSEGKTFTADQAARNRDRTSIVSAAAQAEFMRINQVEGVNPAFLQKSGFITSLMSVNQSAMNTAGKGELEDKEVKILEGIRFKLGAAAGDAVQTKAAVEEAWAQLAPMLGFEKALTFLQKTFSTTEGKEGNPAYNVEGLKSAQIGPNGKTFGEYWAKNRVAEIETTLAQAKNSAFQLEQETNRNNAIKEFQDLLPSIMAQLEKAGPQEDKNIIETLIEAQRNQYNGIAAPGLLDLQKRNYEQNREEARAQANIALDKINKGIATPGDIAAISDLDLRNEVQKEYNKVQVERIMGPDTETTIKMANSGAKEILKEALEGPGSVKAIDLSQKIQQYFSQDYQEGLRRFNGDTSRALTYARDKLMADIEAGKKNVPGSRYSSTLGPGNETIFSWEKDKAVSRNRQAQREDTIRSMIQTQGVGALRSPNLVATDEQLRQMSMDSLMGRAVNYTPEVRLAANLLQRPLPEIVNLAIQARNPYLTTKVAPLAPDPILQQVNRAHKNTLRDIHQYRSKQAAQRAAAESYPGALSDPGNMRGGFRSVSTTYNGSPGQRAFIQTVRSVEGTGGSDGYNKVYGGAVVPQLTKMTLRELYDAIKLGGTDRIPARLGGGKIPFKKDKYNSSASGALQIMPGTLLGLIERGKYKWTDVFSPEIQDQMIIDLAMEGGINPDKMDLNQMTKAGNIWAGLTPRYGQTRRTAEQSFNIYRQFLSRN